MDWALSWAPWRGGRAIFLAGLELAFSVLLCPPATTPHTSTHSPRLVLLEVSSISFIQRKFSSPLLPFVARTRFTLNAL